MAFALPTMKSRCFRKMILMTLQTFTNALIRTFNKVHKFHSWGVCAQL